MGSIVNMYASLKVLKIMNNSLPAEKIKRDETIYIIAT